jgi:hypothetical protein
MESPSVAALLTRERAGDEDHPLARNPTTGKVAFAPISSAYAEAYVAVGIERAEHHANWGV